MITLEMQHSLSNYISLINDFESLKSVQIWNPCYHECFGNSSTASCHHVRVDPSELNSCKFDNEGRQEGEEQRREDGSLG